MELAGCTDKRLEMKLVWWIFVFWGLANVVFHLGMEMKISFPYFWACQNMPLMKGEKKKTAEDPRMVDIPVETFIILFKKVGNGGKKPNISAKMMRD